MGALIYLEEIPSEKNVKQLAFGWEWLLRELRTLETISTVDEKHGKWFWVGDQMLPMLQGSHAGLGPRCEETEALASTEESA